MKIRRKMRQKQSHGVSWGAIVVVLACCLVAYGTVQGVFGVINSWLENLPSIEDPHAFEYAQKTSVYAADEATLLAEFYLEDREPITIEQVSPYVLKGTVATEDVRYYEHNGVDPQGIARALFVNLQGGDLEGASTITQQFVRATVLQAEANDISLKRKVREAQLAIDLEKRYSKDEILMLYLNTINYGDGCWGIEAAARNYFQKHAIDLTIAEAATLIGIPQSPTYLNPINNADACLERRNLVLERMLSYGTISQEEHDAAKAEPLTLNLAPDRPVDGIQAYPYFTSYVRQLLLERYSETEIFEGGLTVYTTIDPAMQAQAEEAARAQYDRMSDQFALALTAIDTSNGYIKAMIGGKDESYQENQYNLAAQALHSPGSAFKPFTLVTAIEQGINPSTKIDCSSPYAATPTWTLENYGGGSYGIQTIQQATAISSNTGYIRLVQQTTPEAATEVARRMGITSPNVAPNLSQTLGTGEVTTVEMASAYSTIATGGLRREPVAIVKIVDKSGQVVFQHEDAPKRVLSEEVAYATTKVLKTVFGLGGTAGNVYLPGGRPIAGKTGTSEDWYDSYLCGYSMQIACATWIGSPGEVEVTMPESLDCTILWDDFMTRAHEGLPIVDFPAKADPPYDNKFNQTQSGLYDKKDPPNLVGKTIEEAISALADFDAEYVEEYSDTVPAGVVISQEMVGEKVRLHISKGPDPAKVKPPVTPPEPDPEVTDPKPEEPRDPDPPPEEPNSTP